MNPITGVTGGFNAVPCNICPVSTSYTRRHKLQVGLWISARLTWGNMLERALHTRLCALLLPESWGTRELRTGELGTGELGTRELGTRELGTGELRTGELGTIELGNH